MWPLALTGEGFCSETGSVAFCTTAAFTVEALTDSAALAAADLLTDLLRAEALPAVCFLAEALEAVAFLAGVAAFEAACYFLETDAEPFLPDSALALAAAVFSL